MGLVLLFFLTNMDPSMSSVFSFILIIGFILYWTDKTVNIRLESKPNRVRSVAVALVAYFVFVVVSAFVLSGLKLIPSFSFTSAASTYSQYLASLFSSYSPALAGNALAVIVAWCVVIPIVETFAFFGGYLEWLSEKFNVPLAKRGPRFVLVVILVAVIFMLFHLTAKGVSNNPGLIMTAIFGLVSGVLVFYTGQLLEAILLHIFTNTIGVLSTPAIGLAVGATVPMWLIIALVGIALYYIVVHVKFFDRLLRRI